MKNFDLRSILDLDGADLAETPLHDVLALQHELTTLALEVLLLPDSDSELSHLLHLLGIHGCCFHRVFTHYQRRRWKRGITRQR